MKTENMQIIKHSYYDSRVNRASCGFPQLHTITMSKRKLDIFGNDLDSNTI